MRNKAGLLNELRNSLALEALRAGMTKQEAEQYATDEIRRNTDDLDKPSILRKVVRGCRILAGAR